MTKPRWLDLYVGDNFYRLTRGIFEPSALRSFEVRQGSPKGALVLDGKKLTAKARNEQYGERLAKDVGVASFEQLVFLVHFVMTFDERRHLLFWDTKVLEQALHLAFGVDRADAARADGLRRDAEKADSLARNANWQASEVRKKIDDLTDQLEGGTKADEVVVKRHKALLKQVEALRTRIAGDEDELRDASLNLTDLSAQQASLRTEYAEEFSKRVQTNTQIGNHPLVVTSLADGSCGLCGATGGAVAPEIKRRCNDDQCPLCGSAVDPKAVSPKNLKRLKEIDVELVLVAKKLTGAAASVKRISGELETRRPQRTELEAELKGFEDANRKTLARLNDANDGGSVHAVLDVYRKQFEGLLKKKQDQYEKRDEKRTEQRKILREMEKQYRLAEEEFVPLFRDLATSFLGLDLDIRLDTKTLGTTLVLEVRSATRRQPHQLSESQRFFIDIALRMALTQFMVGAGERSCLFVDTPEGSLDIAYESRAGKMLAKFVARGNNIIMTANINTSRLLLSLAEACGNAAMSVCRMTTWAELSEVQQQEEKGFRDAFKILENALNQKAGASET